jgi:hypothetical protein
MDSHVESICLRELGDECEFALLAVQEMNRALKEPIANSPCPPLCSNTNLSRLVLRLQVLSLARVVR